MKRIIPFLLIIPVLITGCKIKSYTPELPVVFKQSATVSSGDFSFECEICCDESSCVVNILSTKAQGLCYKYDGKALLFKYDDFEYSIEADSSLQGNTAVIMYELCRYISTDEEINVKRIEDGYKYEGEIDFGYFILIQNEDNTLRSLSFRNSDFVVNFK